MLQDPIQTRSLAVGAIINTTSGGTNDATKDKLEAIISEAGVVGAQIWSVEAEKLEGAFAQALSHDLDVLIVFGGDGTIRTAAQGATMEGPVLLPLPGGTMNLLPKALYGDMGWEEIVRTTFERPSVRTISGGKVGKERFFIAAIFGAPALWTKAREALREGELATALEEGKQALENLFASKVNYSFNELHEGSAEAVSVICPLISNTLADDRQVLEAAVIDAPGAGELLQLASAAAFGEWRDAQNVAVVTTKHVRISSETQIPVIVDGEMISAGTTLDVEFVPEAFKVLVPASA